MFGNGKGGLDQLAQACALILASALCLYWAVQLICAIWQTLAIIGGLVALVSVSLAIWRWRQSQW